MFVGETPRALVTVGLLVSGALLGQEQSTGQVQPADFAKMQEALASQREALAAQQKQLEIQQQEIQELKSLLRKQVENQTEFPDSTGALAAKTCRSDSRGRNYRGRNSRGRTHDSPGRSHKPGSPGRRRGSCGGAPQRQSSGIHPRSGIREGEAG